jgi:hypothetical protein
LIEQDTDKVAKRKEICVVHLVRPANGIAPFRRFLESYRINPGGIEHDLLVVFKGSRPSHDTAEYSELLAPIRQTTLDISDEGLDITAYFAAAGLYWRQYRFFCFLNSYSVILDPDWLKKLHNILCMPDVGLVGATGSWISHRISALTFLRNRSKYKREHRHKNLPSDNTGAGIQSDRRWFPTLIAKIEPVWRLFRYGIYFDYFPSYHIRTNCFMIEGKLMNSFRRPIRTKIDAYKFESGKKGLTRNILAMGKKVLVVGADGRGYEKEAWCESNTFFQSEQENLLVADNQTREYEYGSPDRRRFLSSLAWNPGG